MAELKIVKVGAITYVPAEMGDTVRTRGRSFEDGTPDRIHIPFGLPASSTPNTETRVDVILDPAEARALFAALNDALLSIA